MTTRPTQVLASAPLGSIGRSTLEVIAAAEGALTVLVLSAHRYARLLAEQARRFRPRWVAVTDPQAAERCDWPPCR